MKKLAHTLLSGSLLVWGCLLTLPLQAQQSAGSVSDFLAEITIQTNSNEISERAFTKAKMSIIDIVGVAAAGFDAPAIPEIRSQFTEWGGKAEAGFWFTDQKVPTPVAGFVNSSTAHAMDLDDYHRASGTHISVVVVPAVLAIGELMQSSGQELLEAIVVGVEVAAHIGEPFKSAKKHGRFLPTSVVGGFGAVAAACRLMKLDMEQTKNAFGIFYAHASGNRQALFDRTLTKRIQPAIAVKAGIMAAHFAANGMTGPDDIFLSDAGLLRIYGNADYPLPSVEDFQKKESRWEIEDLCFKKYASCGAAHPAVEAALQLTLENDLTIDKIASIELFNIWVGTGMVDVPWKDAESPQALAQFCAPYNVASVIKNRKFGPAEISPETIARDKDVDELAKKIVIKSKEEWGEGYPGGHTVRIKTKDGKELVASFEPADLFNPEEFSLEGIIEKFHANIAFSRLLNKNQAAGFIKAILVLENIEKIGSLVPVSNHSEGK